MWAGILRFLQCTCLCIASVLYKQIFCELFYYLHVLLNSSLTCCFQQTPLPLLPPRFASQAQHYLTELSEVPWGKVPWFNKVSASSNQLKNGMALSGSFMCVVQDWNLRDLILRFHWGLLTFLFRRISVLLRMRWKTPYFFLEAQPQKAFNSSSCFCGSTYSLCSRLWTSLWLVFLGLNKSTGLCSSSYF